MKLSEVLETLEQMDEKTKGSLGKWFREKWVDISRTNKDGSHPPCGASAGKKSRAGGKRAYPKCVPASKAASMSKTKILKYFCWLNLRDPIKSLFASNLFMDFSKVLIVFVKFNHFARLCYFINFTIITFSYCHTF